MRSVRNGTRSAVMRMTRISLGGRFGWDLLMRDMKAARSGLIVSLLVRMMNIIGLIDSHMPFQWHRVFPQSTN